MQNLPSGGRDGQITEVAAFASNADLEIINNPESTPTFSDWKGMSWINILLVQQCAREIADCVISEQAFSDHNQMIWSYLGKPASKNPLYVCCHWQKKDLNWNQFVSFT